MKRAIALFCSFVLIFIFTLPEPYAADNILAEKRQKLFQFFNRSVPYFPFSEKLSEQLAPRHEINDSSVHELTLNQEFYSSMGIDSEETSILEEILHSVHEFLPIISDVNIHDNMFLSLEFNDVINPNSITNETLFIVNSTGERVPTLIINDSIKTVTILPPVDKYEVSETYSLYLTDGIKNASGQKINERFMIQFTVQDTDDLQDPSQSMKLNFNFETGYEGATLIDDSPIIYEHDLINDTSGELDEIQLDEEFLMMLMKKFDEKEELQL